MAEPLNSSKEIVYAELRARIQLELSAAGFIVTEDGLELPAGDAKNTYRKLHYDQRQERLLSSIKTIKAWED